MALSVTTSTKDPYASPNNVIITAPASISVDDFLVAIIFLDDVNTIVTPTGWTLHNTYSQDGDSVHIFSKIAVTADTTAVDYTFESGTTGAFPQGGVIFNVKDAANLTPLIDFLQYNSATDVTAISDTVSIAQNANSQDGSLVILFAHSTDNIVDFGSYSITGPAADAFTEVLDLGSGTTNSAVAYTFTNNLSTITQYDIDIVGNISGVWTAGIIVIPSFLAISTTHSIVVANASENSPTLSSSMTANHSIVTAEATTNQASASAKIQTQWQAETKPSTSWNKETL